MSGRRDFLRRGGQTMLVVLAAPGVLAACGSDGPDCAQASAAEQAERAAAHYVAHTTSGTRNCTNCTFFTDHGAATCGACSMNLGAVSPLGVCDRFAARA
ncbi:MAG: hypothetical protein IPQ07_41130 [Myxococcales bacterium]|nr:hypothetical protein [Myxococcales bacterium]